jgi:RNA recognition motif-containing protein
MGSQGAGRVAQITFQKRTDANSAIQQYNGVLLDGKPMKIQMMAEQPAAQQHTQQQRAPSATARLSGARTVAAAPPLPPQQVTFSVRL